jgi:hypothetical protein
MDVLFRGLKDSKKRKYYFTDAKNKRKYISRENWIDDGGRFIW